MWKWVFDGQRVELIFTHSIYNIQVFLNQHSMEAIVIISWSNIWMFLCNSGHLLYNHLFLMVRCQTKISMVLYFSGEFWKDISLSLFSAHFLTEFMTRVSDILKKSLIRLAVSAFHSYGNMGFTLMLPLYPLLRSQAI